MQTSQMANMAAMNATQGPVDGTPMMGNGPHRVQQNGALNARDQLNTYIYDYFLRNKHFRLARMMIECDLKMSLTPPQKSSPSGRNTNGVDPMEESKEDLPSPKIPQNHSADNSFLLDWWLQFWDIWGAARGHNPKNVPMQYIQHARQITQMQNDARASRMLMAGNMGGQYPAGMMRMANGVAPNDLKRAAAMNNRNPNGNPMANNMNQMKNPAAMMSAQMQRDGSQMEMNGQRSQSPGSNDNGAPSPNKRPRVEGPMNAGNMPGAQFGEFNTNAPNVQNNKIEGMNSGMQGSPMPQQGLDGQENMYTGNPPRGMAPGAPGPPQGNHALQDYQMQLMLLEQQNKKRLLMARQEQDSMAAPHAQGPGFPASMSPQGSRAGPSPNPADQMKKGTPRMGQSGLPGSPMPPEGAMQPQRNSPAPAMPGAGFDPNGANMPQGMHQYGFPGQMPQGPMMGRPPSSHPGNFPGQQLTPQQMEQMQRNGMPNGVWRGPQGQPGMMPNPQQMGPMGGNPQQRGQMPPPPAPPASEQPRTQEPSPSQPAQAPPTPSTANKAPPKKKATKDTKPATKKGANTGATPAASGAEEPPTPSTPITPMHPKSFGTNGQQQPSQPAAQQPPQAAQQQAQNMDIGQPFGSLGDESGFDNLNLGFGDDNTLENFDFESFLHVGDDSNGFGGLGGDFGFEVEAGGDQ